MSRSPVQRFISELRRRHVPQTAAIYLVAAWAAIEFADVVVPNLNGPQWVVTAVIVAALVGFPVMLVVAWVFEWGPEGLHRTETDADDGPAIGGVRGESAPSPWLAVLAVLVVGIGSALAVTFVLRSQGESEAAAPGTSGSAGDTTEAGQAGATIPAIGPPSPAVPSGQGDSLRAEMVRAFGVLDSIDFSGLAEIGREVAAEVGLGIVLSRPEQWRVGAGPSPVPLPERDTLMVEGMAYDTAGIVAVVVDGDTVATAESQPTVPFSARMIGTGSVGIREVVITARTRDGREVRRAFQIIQLPAGTP